ncbi:MAG TPA: DUF420 domain-containing protein [Planctomycetota bacterium]|nr:DUF420 domain-containing protein [Planctomycetota bacterium]
MTGETLAGINATLNFGALCALVAGWVLIKRGRQDAHRRAMLLATGLSALFLVGYVWRNAQFGDRKFPADHPWRTPYLAFLAVHLLLALVNVPLIVVVLRRAFRGDFAGHRRLARILFPSWIYVSTTGILIYFILFRWLPAPAAPVAGG